MTRYDARRGRSPARRHRSARRDVQRAATTPSGRLVALTDELGRHDDIAYNAAGRVVGSSRRIGSRSAAGVRRRRARIVVGAPGDGPPATIEYDTLGASSRCSSPAHRPTGCAGTPNAGSSSAAAATWRCAGPTTPQASARRSCSRTAARRPTCATLAARSPRCATPPPARSSSSATPPGGSSAARADGMHARWGYEDGALAEYEMHAGDRRSTARLRRDDAGRVVAAMLDGAEHEFAYDAAGQLVVAATPAGAYMFDYDAGGRLVRESSPTGDMAYEYDAAGRLVAEHRRRRRRHALRVRRRRAAGTRGRSAWRAALHMGRARTRRSDRARRRGHDRRGRRAGGARRRRRRDLPLGHRRSAGAAGVATATRR